MPYRLNPFTNKQDFFESGGTGSGTVTSVALTTPTGLTVTGSPITTSGTFDVTLTAGYVIPTTAQLSTYVVGPASAVNGNLAVFDGTTGKLIKDGGAPPSGGATTGQLSYFADAGGAPSGWLKCDGSVVAQATYPALFTQLGLINGRDKVWKKGSNFGGATVALGYGNGRYVAFLATGLLLTSTDATTWTETVFPFTNVVSMATKLVYGDKFVWAGGSGSLFTSTDGLTWTARTSGTASTISSLGYGGGAYLYVTSAAQYPVYTSTDAITWTNISLQIPGQGLSPIAYGGGRFVMITPSRAYTTTDVVTWKTSKPQFGTSVQGSPTSVIFENSIYVCGGTSGNIHTSTDSLVWTIHDSKTSSTINALTFGSSLFVYGGLGGAIATSTDAVTWTARTSGTASAILAVGNAPSLTNKYIAAGAGGNLRTSTDAITWDARTSGTTSSIQTVTFGTVYVYGALNGTIRTSTDGVTWDARTSGTSSQIFSLCYSGSLYLYGGDNVLATSTDAITWSAATTPYTTFTVNCITFANSLYLAGTNQGRLLTSTNAVTWTERFTGRAGIINSITWDGAKYFAAGDNGVQMATSTDAVTWTPYTPQLNVAQLGNSVAYGNGVFVMVAATGNLSTSTDGLTWTPRVTNYSANFNAIEFGNGRFYVNSAAGTTPVMLTSTDGVTWDPTYNTAPVFFDTQASTLGFSFNPTLIYGDRFLSSDQLGNFYSTNTDYSYDDAVNFQIPEDSYSVITRQTPSNFQRSLYIKT